MAPGLLGVGLRSVHYADVLEGRSRMNWFEVISENYMDTGGRPFQVLEKVRANYPVGVHGVSLNIGSPDPISKIYLKNLKAFVRAIDPVVVSDHLCWGGMEGRNWHDLLPMPMNEKVLKHTVSKIKQVMDVLERPIALENISTYLRFASDTMSEAEFTKALLEEANCQILLDVNNAYVNEVNHNEDAEAFIRAIPSERIAQYHLAGYSTEPTFLFDTHDHPVSDPVWKLLETTIRIHGPRPLILERDDAIPELKEIEDEAFKAGSYFPSL